MSSSRSPRPSISTHSRSAARKSPTKRATTSSRPDFANAERNVRGLRWPKKLPVCVTRKRSPEWYSSPVKSSKSDPLGITRTAPAGSKRRTSAAIGSATSPPPPVGDRLGDCHHAVGRAGDQPHHALERLLLGADGSLVESPVGVSEHRV